MTQPQHNSHGLSRRLGLPSAVALNMMDMIGVGPFLTLPLVLAAAGSQFAVWAWLLGAAIAACDGLVSAELGASFPRAGGSYAFLNQIYGPEGAGRWLSFLYVWQLSFSAPLSIASGCIGLATFLGFLIPQLAGVPFAALPFLHGTNLAAAATCLLVTALLYRNLSSITRLAGILFAGVMLTVGGVLTSGLVTGSRIPGAWGWAHTAAWPSMGLLPALATATMITCYDYWGYYNICFLGAEVKRPEKTIPRAILLSILAVAIIYVAMNFAAVPAYGAQAAQAAHGSAAVRLALVADIAQSAGGRLAGQAIAALILWSAFASIFSLLLGYSRVPYAAAHDGNYFRALGAVHPRHGFPHRSLLALGFVATLFCFFPLKEVIALLVVIRIVLQFLLQQVGVIWLRLSQPNLPRPFRMPLFPLPPLLAITGFLFILAYRPNPFRELGVALALALVGTLIYLIRARSRLQWPFRQKPFCLPKSSE